MSLDCFKSWINLLLVIQGVLPRLLVHLNRSFANCQPLRVRISDLDSILTVQARRLLDGHVVSGSSIILGLHDDVTFGSFAVVVVIQLVVADVLIIAFPRNMAQEFMRISI